MKISLRWLMVVVVVTVFFAASSNGALALCGDVNEDGAILSNDVLIEARASLGIFNLSDDQKSRADVVPAGRGISPDGMILSNDLLLVARASLGMIALDCAAGNGTSISGTVMAPDGVSLGRKAGRSAAANNGLRGKSGVTVTVILVDDRGEQRGNEIAHGTTDANGNFSINIPANIDPDSIFVFVVGGGHNKMRAMIISKGPHITRNVADINPMSELVTAKIIENSQPLSDYTDEEIVAITNQVETNLSASSIDLSTAASVDEALATMSSDSTLIANLEQSIHTASGNYCGDSTVNGFEQCDNGGSNTNTPCTAGYNGSCNYCDATCHAHTVNGGSCGDGTINGSEQCDIGSANNGVACTPSYGGSCTYCSSSCTNITLMGHSCGDGSVQSANGEQCDAGGNNTDTPCTASYGGTCDYCSTSCQTVAVTGPHCGDGIKNGSEACDGADLGGATCQSLGAGNTGTPTCSACSLVTTGCTTTTTFISPQYTETCTLPNGGTPRGNFPCGPNECVADPDHNQVVVFNKTTCDVVTTIPVLGAESGCVNDDGSQFFVTRGQYGQFSLITYNSGNGSYTHVGDYGSAGTGTGQLLNALQCALDSSATNLFIINDGGISTSGHNVLKWEVAQLDNPTTHGYVTFFGSKGTSSGKFTNPTGIQTIAGKIFVSDGTGRIQKFDLNGVVDPNFVLNVGASFYLGKNPANGWIYSQDSTAAIGVFSSTDGSLVGHVNVGGSSAGNISGGVSVTASSDGAVYVTDDAGEKRYRLP